MSTKKIYRGNYLVLDTSTNKITECPTIASVAAFVKVVSRETVVRSLRLGIHRLSNTSFMVKRKNDKREWGKEDEQLDFRPLGPRPDYSVRPVKCLDIISGEIKTYPNAAAAAKDSVVARSLVYQSLKCASDTSTRPGVVNGQWVFRFEDDEFPNLNNLTTRSIDSRAMPSKVMLRVLPYELVVTFNSLAECAQATEIDLREIKNNLRRGQQRTSIPFYLIKSPLDKKAWVE